jgi:hypothetical protein
MATEIILSGITFEQLQNSFRSIVKNEVEQIIKNLPTSQEPASELITRKETAYILGISLPTLNEWTKTGIIPAQCIGTRVRYLRSSVYNSLKDVETVKYRRS